MKLTPEQELENAQIKVSYFKVCDHFGLTEAEALNPNAGEWLIDVIKQCETALTLHRSMKLRSNENQKVETYSPPPPPMPSKESALQKITNVMTGGKNDAGEKI
jgi:hypothetical protein